MDGEIFLFLELTAMTDLRTTLQYVGLSGHALSVAEETALHCSLTVLSQQTKKDVKFWGKVLGYNGDYSLRRTPLPMHRRGRPHREPHVHQHGRLPHVDHPRPGRADQREFCEQVRGLFMGDPSYEYRIQKILPPEEDAPAAATEAAKPEGAADG